MERLPTPKPLYDKARSSLNAVRSGVETMPLPQVALSKVTSKTGAGVYASSDTLYSGAVFGRDSLEVAEDIIHIKPKLVRNILITLASLQGTIEDPVSEEEKGKIIHEYRTTVVDGKKINRTSMAIFQALAEKWGGNEREMAYYGSVDATPMYLRVIETYIKIHGDDILHEKITNRRGQVLYILDTVELAAIWLMQKLESSQSGLLEFKRMNPHGIANQAWKDSEEFYTHESGERANHEGPIASIELQSLAYDGLLAASRLVPGAKESLEQAAIQVRDRTISLLWQPDSNSFALGTDFDSEGGLRIIRTPSANQAMLLDSGFFDGLDESSRQHYITGIVRLIMGPDFLTDGGIRSRSLKAAGIVQFWDYHGSYVSWAKETYDVAKGLKRHGFPRLARQLENRILNVCLRYKAYPEFVYVDAVGRVLASPPKNKTHGDFILIDASNHPERIQAWTVSAVLAIVHERVRNKLRRKQPLDSTSWQYALEEEILRSIPAIDRHFNPIALGARYPRYQYMIKRK